MPTSIKSCQISTLSAFEAILKVGVMGIRSNRVADVRGAMALRRTHIPVREDCMSGLPVGSQTRKPGSPVGYFLRGSRVNKRPGFTSYSCQSGQPKV